MKVDFFSDDLGLNLYTFTDCTYKDVALYLIENHTSFQRYKITNIFKKRKYWLFGTLTIQILAETDEAVARYGGGKIPVYQIREYTL